MANGRSRGSGAMSALTILGLGLWVVDLLVVFFAPAAIRLGHGSSFVGVILVLALVGLVLVLLGRRERTA